MNITQFELQRQKAGLDYDMLSPMGQSYAHFRFIGHFRSAPTIWDAHLYSLAYYFKEIRPSASATQPVRQFILVGDESDTGRKITIGLNLPIIDKPVIMKTMIMIRQYKRLRYGCYEYGELITI